MQMMNQNYKQPNNTNSNLEDRISFEEIIDTILQCMNITISYSPTNRVALYVFDEENVDRVFPITDEDELNMRMLNFRKIKLKIHNSILNFLDKKTFSVEKTSKFALALSKILCYINKFQSENANEEYNKRILILQTSHFPEREFTNVMNCVHVCKNRNIVIDAIYLGKDPDNPDKGLDYLKQACKNTDGLYSTFNYLATNKDNNKNFLQLFLHSYNLGIENRKHFKVPGLTKTNYTACCFCCQKNVDIAWICSVCLAIYCNTEF